MTAEVLDLKFGRKVGVIHVDASAKLRVGVIVIFPYVLPAFTETGLCGDLGDEVAMFLAGETMEN